LKKKRQPHLSLLIVPETPQPPHLKVGVPGKGIGRERKREIKEGKGKKKNTGVGLLC